MEVNVYCAHKFKRFKMVKREEYEMNEDDPRPGRPLTSKTDDNIMKIGKIKSLHSKTLF